MSAYTESQQIWDELGRIAPDWKTDTQRASIHKLNFAVTRRQFATIAIAACAAMASVGVGWLLHAPTYKTAVGEQKLARLADGTRIILNTDTVFKVRYSRGERRIEMVQGEALFDVAHDPDRPFIVAAAQEYIRAVGTSFVVRRDNERVEVTLLSGVVDVTRKDNGLDKVSLSPGQRFRRADNQSVELDRPRLEVVTAWRNGQLILDETPLRAAIAEMNRYSTKDIHLDTQAVDGTRLSGVFRVDETRRFAETVAGIHGLTFTETESGMNLSDNPG
ncbi:FecR domain-containing protein [Asticcacaulis sp. SL142]|uniref:FecR family protein n=1 Tax=Asticcacaulis sp. SL142 TaxID=2995155 RepID=UPI00226C990D|nr:FecR domain-containing protein [Asticcacaulis sp. SL142]WAC49194.1 FecR domain-containing protein [Asticcacaulis sp. SL142]